MKILSLIQQTEDVVERNQEQIYQLLKQNTPEGVIKATTLVCDELNDFQKADAMAYVLRVMAHQYVTLLHAEAITQIDQNKALELMNKVIDMNRRIETLVTRSPSDKLH